MPPPSKKPRFDVPASERARADSVGFAVSPKTIPAALPPRQAPTARRGNAAFEQRSSALHRRQSNSVTQTLRKDSPPSLTQEHSFLPPLPSEAVYQNIWSGIANREFAREDIFSGFCDIWSMCGYGDLREHVDRDRAGLVADEESEDEAYTEDTTDDDEYSDD